MAIKRLIPSLAGAFAVWITTANGEMVEVSINGEETPFQSDRAKDELWEFPTLVYGTAWKKEHTTELVLQAMEHGFRHFDTACQPKHYQEDLVGEAFEKSGLSRHDVWFQTKYTSVSGQDPNRIPYDKDASLTNQVLQSFDKSLENLRVTYIDSYIMHGPEDSWEANFEVWRAMESLYQQGKVGQLGVSNWYDLDALQYLYEHAVVKPKVVQNRFYKDSGYDAGIRTFCLEHNIQYQSFWTLGANSHAIHDIDDIWKKMAATHHISSEALMYVHVMQLGITPLDGATHPIHVKEDLEMLDLYKHGKLILSEEEMEICNQLLTRPKAGSM